MKKVTLQTIADKLSVSKALVSKALAHDPAVSDVTKEAIWRTAEELGYRFKSSDRQGKTPVPGTGNFVALMPNGYLNDIEYWGKVIQGVHNELTVSGGNMILTGIDTAASPEEGMPPIVTQGKIDGIIALGHLPGSYIEALRATGIPLALVDANVWQTDVDHVMANNFIGAYQTVGKLMDAGHRRLAFVGDANSAYSFAERKRGFEQAVVDRARIHPGAGYVTTLIEGMGVSATGNYRLDAFAEQIKLALTGERPVTGMFCANDMIAIEVLKVVAECGLSCPADVSVCGFDDLAWGELASPKLTTVNVPRVELGKKAVRLLRRRIEDPDCIAELVLLPTTFVERESTRTVGE